MESDPISKNGPSTPHTLPTFPVRRRRPSRDGVFRDINLAYPAVVAYAAKRSTIELGREAGNTHYDSVSHCILVAVQTKNQWVAIDPVSERIVQRYDLV